MEQSFSESMGLTGELIATLRDFRTGEITQQHFYKNLNPLAIRAAIMSHLTNPSPTPASLTITHGAVGTGTDAPTQASENLQTEIERVTVSSLSNANNVGYVTIFFNETEAVGLLREAGLFADASSLPDSGTMASHVSINITKSPTETLTLDWTLNQN